MPFGQERDCAKSILLGEDMGLFDSIVSAVEGQAGGQGNLMEAAMGMINHPEVGGVNGLMTKLAQGGLGAQVASWVSTGQNLPVSAEQLQAVLNTTGLNDIAAKFGLHTDDAVKQLSSLLPQLIDHLTPNGQLPPAGDLTHQVLAGLGGLFGNKTV